MVNLSKSILAGLLISLGCISYLVSDDKFIGSVLFSIGLLTILKFNLKLFTGMLCNVCNKELNLNIIDFIICYIGNFIGAFIGSLFIHYTKLNYLQEKINSIAYAKNNDDLISLVLLGVLCELCIFIAVKSNKDILVVFAVTVFVFCGFEHCVADMFYMISSNLNNYILCLLAVSIGNIMSGSVLSLLYYNN